MTSIFKQINYFVAKKPFASLLCLVIGIKQLIHIDIDQRQFTDNRGIESLKSLRPSFFNKMIIFSFVQKLFLLIALLNNLTYFKQYIANESLSSFDFIILIMSIISLILIGKRFKKYVLNQILMGQESLEIDSIDQLKSHIQNFKQKRFISKYRNLKAVYIYIQHIKQEDIELFIYTVFSAFGKSEIFGDKFERKLIVDVIQQQAIYFHIGIEFSQVNNVISKYKIQPQISQLIGHFTSIDNLQEFYLLMSNHSQLIQIDINSDFFFEDVCMLNKIFCKWQEITKFQYVAYNKQLKNQLIYNPQASFYDLYELK
ncbi:transmembrane protein, putative (macronuclear) [Tetrahymena thermophila SB210]|uniref:Transmembrane protein, putative n=1 Tax=Tetrahymena thermophila (strain SB210) TaxID=312017 RepID=Q23RI3_TETTS|nr:transmembrane protein, putative [Tetrahymena thermophila SB210]EAR99065.2 transmembrane protein, putative [Tetrahymena thermophila SB210]|eukprot:XP_001019310.2 transmembrane protein, putative [Tetrahymena thermophila SB210]